MSKKSAARLFWLTIVRATVQSGSTLSVLLISGVFGHAAVALYSVAFAAIALIVVVFDNGITILLLRKVVHQETFEERTLHRRLQATLLRSPAQYAKAALLALASVVYLYLSTGAEAVRLFLLMSPLLLILPVLNLRSSYHKAIGEPVQASISEAGLIHLCVAALVVISFWSGATDISVVFIYGFAVFALTGAITTFSIGKATRGVAPITDRKAQRAILANAILNFVFRNGFPLFFAAFMATDDLGRFRIDERVFFLVMFLYFFYEAVSVKRLISVFRDPDRRTRLRAYARMAGTVFGTGLIAALALLACLWFDTVSRLIGYSWTGNWTVLMALAIPFYFLATFNNLVLNMVGRHNVVTGCMLAGAIVFLPGTMLVYPALGIDGVRLAYFCGGVTSAVLSGVAVLISQRKAA